MMTKRDFIALADALRGVDVPESVLARLCAFCEASNPQFDERRWRDHLRGDCGSNGGPRCMKFVVVGRDVLRRVRFQPYAKDKGPTFTLTLWDTHTTRCSKAVLGYRLTMSDGGRSVVLFKGDNYGCSPCHAIDSDEAVEGIMSFLTLRPGDTDAEYFKDYTPTQLAFCREHVETLAVEVDRRFGPPR